MNIHGPASRRLAREAEADAQWSARRKAPEGSVEVTSAIQDAIGIASNEGISRLDLGHGETQIIDTDDPESFRPSVGGRSYEVSVRESFPEKTRPRRVT